MTKIQEQLFKMQDIKYKEFHGKLIPTITSERIIGVRTPELRKFARDFAKSEEMGTFMRSLPHEYYEENNLHGFLIESIRDFDEVILALDEFLPYVDNWATCDMMSPKILKKNTDRLLDKIKEWICASETYTIRFAIGLLMKYYLDENFKTEYLQMVADIKSEEYYVNMMIAWYFATALAKQYDSTLPYIQEKKLDKWIHNKTIQKAIESYRISKEQKEYLKTFKQKNA